ncbi:hypothetical protein TrLO_g15052 [Triparma laevis f. longispina]|uniref:Fatty acid hydroxylase domain-containing protein n=1 Tax=Triparma laevis f. longispina TaxID=1714387 RepID=A0A9W7FU70_9STRA|nr:hypothetical protein TrLO_g15052 [Triparma laevis f. longispina]
MEYFQLIQTKIEPLLPVDASVASAWTLPSLIIHSFSPTVILTYAFLCMSVFILLALEFVNWGTMKIGDVKGKTFPIQAAHLDSLRPIDIFFITFNKLSIPPFFLTYTLFSSTLPSTSSTLLSPLYQLPLLFLLYDLFYSLFHRTLHLQSIYHLIHKHHHTQKSPTRGNLDAVNVHPIEFWSGEWLHLGVVYLLSLTSIECSAITSLTFLTFGGVLASLNHTRYDLCIYIFAIKVYDPKYHDLHHRVPRRNYGQYLMIWDYALGTAKEWSKGKE